MQRLRQRYPDLSFLITHFSHQSSPLVLEADAFDAWLAKEVLEDIEMLYFVGLPGFEIPKEVLAWLKSSPQHALVFIEKDLGSIASFEYDEIWENPQIHLFFIEEDPIETLAGMYPTDRLAVFVPEEAQFDVIELKRQSAALSALYSDVLYSHKISENVLANFLRIENGFAANTWKGAFKGTPAIICGAGPSLEKELAALKKWRSHALIFAGGSTITALTKQGVRPHLSMALDPNEEEFDRLKQSYLFEGPLLFAPRLHRDVFATMNGPFGYMKSDTGGLVESWLEDSLNLTDPAIGPDMGPEAFSVTTLAISYAYALGCDPIILVGVDLAYTGGKRYAPGVEAEEADVNDPRALEHSMIVKGMNGESVETLLKWVMEGDAISAFANSHADVKFYNASAGGLGFNGIKNKRLEPLMRNVSPPMCDLEGEIHQLIQNASGQLNLAQLPALYDDLFSSLKTCQDLVRGILEELQKQRETGRLVLFESDLKEEKAYHCFLDGIEAALDHLNPRYFPALKPEERMWERRIAKYREIDRQIGKFAEILAKISQPSYSL